MITRRKSYEFARLIDPTLPEPAADPSGMLQRPPVARPTLVAPVDIQRSANAYLINGDSYPRVTDILRAVPMQNWLAPWYAKQVVESSMSHADAETG